MFISIYFSLFYILGSIEKMILFFKLAVSRNNFHLQIKHTREIMQEINYQDGKNYFLFKTFRKRSHTQNEDVHKMLKVED